MSKAVAAPGGDKSRPAFTYTFSSGQGSATGTTLAGTWRWYTKPPRKPRKRK